MKKYKDNWLPHLKHAIPKEVFGYTTSMYSIALEGWRRGLNLRFINKNQIKSQTEFILSNKDRRYRFSGSRANIITKEAINICADKHLTKKVLKEQGISVLKGERFHKNIDDEEIVHYVEEFGYPVVLKPYNGNGGEGVIVNIQDEITLRKSLAFVRRKLNHPTVLIERYIPSRAYQLYVIKNEVIAAFERVPAFIIGNGESSINQLINTKNNQRGHNPSLYPYLIDKKNRTLLKLLEEQGYSLDDIPAKDVKILLSIKSTIPVGGEIIDRTDELTKEIKKLATNAAKSIPNLTICAVEIIVDKETQQGYVLELKTQPTISGYLFPVEGTARDIPKAIVDYFFPESISVERDILHYFDFEHIFNAFNNNYIQEYTLPKILHDDKYDTKRIIITGIKDRTEYIKNIRSELLELGINGFFKYRSKGRLELVVVGSIKKIESINTILDNRKYLQAENYKMIEQDWHKPIKIGFEIKSFRNNRKTILQKKLQKTSKFKMVEKVNTLDKIIATIKNVNFP